MTTASTFWVLAVVMPPDHKFRLVGLFKTLFVGSGAPRPALAACVIGNCSINWNSLNRILLHLYGALIICHMALFRKNT